MTQKSQIFWDKNAKRYDESERQFEAVNKVILEKTSNYLDLKDHVLDFGCATGTKTIELSNKVQQIHGLDISTEMINAAVKKKEALKISNITFSQGTIFSKELEPASFNKIISFAVIHLLEDKEDVIHRIYELLKPGGLFISSTACFKDKMAFKNRLQFSTCLLMKKLELFPLQLNRFNMSDVEKLMTDQHFTILEAEKMYLGMSSCFIVAQSASDPLPASPSRGRRMSSSPQGFNVNSTRIPPQIITNPGRVE